MALDDKYEDIQKLIDTGKEKGYLTYDQVNDLLPGDIHSPDDLDDLLTTIGTQGIDVLEGPKMPGAELEKTADIEAGEDVELDLTPGALEKTNDPVRMYLREMGTVPLLTREGEVEIAKRIERGQLRVLKAISRSPIVIREVLAIGDDLMRGLKLALPGDYQLDNVACAVAALALFDKRFRKRGFAVPDAAIRKGLATVRWPARLETLKPRPGKPAVLLDAAHNQDGADALARHLQARPAPRSKRVLVFGALADKEHGSMLRVLAAVCDEVIVCEPNVSRAAPMSELLRVARRAKRARSTADALAKAHRLAGARGEIVVAGSIFLVAEARGLLLGVRSDPQIRM